MQEKQIECSNQIQQYWSEKRKIMDASIDDTEIDPFVRKTPTIESFESMINNVKLRGAHKIKLEESVLDLILHSNRLNNWG